MGHRHALGDFQFEKCGIQARIVDGVLYGLIEPLLPEVQRRDIDGNDDVGDAAVLKALVERAGFAQNPFTDGNNQPPSGY